MAGDGRARHGDGGRRPGIARSAAHQAAHQRDDLAEFPGVGPGPGVVDDREGLRRDVAERAARIRRARHRDGRRGAIPRARRRDDDVRDDAAHDHRDGRGTRSARAAGERDGGRRGVARAAAVHHDPADAIVDHHVADDVAGEADLPDDRMGRRARAAARIADGDGRRLAEAAAGTRDGVTRDAGREHGSPQHQARAASPRVVDRGSRARTCSRRRRTRSRCCGPSRTGADRPRTEYRARRTTSAPDLDPGSVAIDRRRGVDGRDDCGRDGTVGSRRGAHGPEEGQRARLGDLRDDRDRRADGLRHRVGIARERAGRHRQHVAVAGEVREPDIGQGGLGPDGPAAQGPPDRGGSRGLERDERAGRQRQGLGVADGVGPHRQVRDIVIGRDPGAGIGPDLEPARRRGVHRERCGLERQPVDIDRLGAVRPRDEDVIADPELDGHRGGNAARLAVEGHRQHARRREIGDGPEAAGPLEDRGPGRQVEPGVAVDLQEEPQRRGRLVQNRPSVPDVCWSMACEARWSEPA